MRVLIIVKSDFKNIIRDKSILMILFLPIVFWILLRFVPPYGEKYFPVMQEYRAYFLSLFCLLSPVLLGFVLSFLILEEKDQNLVPLFQVLPLSIHKFMVIRVSFILLFSFVSGLLLITTTGLIYISFWKAVALAFACSFIGPANAFIITAIARNKIEGVTFFKLLSLLLLAPIAGLFIPSDISMLFGIIPYYWIYLGFIPGNPALVSVYIFIAVGYQVVFVLSTYYLYIRKTYR
jgi:fluoroquinolone transport system permease protein